MQVDTLDFRRRTVFITGGAGGIALETARCFLALGAKVALTDRDRAGLERARSALGGGERVDTICADILSSSQVGEAMARCVDRFGSLDTLVNSAGTYPESNIAQMSDEQWRQVHAVNLDGTFFACRAAASLMKRGASIVNLTSIAAHRGSVGHAHYASSKAAVLGLSRSLAQELAPDVRVNCVSPGPVDTAMIKPLWEKSGDQIVKAIPLGRICTPAEVAKAVVFLASDWASFITAETLHLNGGQYIQG